MARKRLRRTVKHLLIATFGFAYVDEEDEADDDDDELNEMPHLIHASYVESNEEMSDGNVNEVEETGKE